MDKESDEIQSLSKQEMDFVNSYIIDHNATRAYLKVFGDKDENGKPRKPSTVRSEAYRLTTKPSIRKEIRDAERHICRRNRVTPLRIVAELAAIAFADIGDYYEFDTAGLPHPKNGNDITQKARKAIQEIRLLRRTIPQEYGDPVVEEEIKYKLHPKMHALEKLYEHLGMNPEKNAVMAFVESLPHEVKTILAKHLQQTLAAASPESDPIHTDNAGTASGQ